MLSWIKVCRKNWRVGSESSDVQPLSKKTPHIDISISSKPPTFENLPHQIHHRSTFRNTPVSKANKLPAQTPQSMKSDVVEKGYSASVTCLGEFSPLQMSDPSSRETNRVESKKRKRLLTETSMELDLEIRDEQNIDAAPPKGPNHHIEAVLPQEF